MIIGIDHMVILVDDLDTACENYRALGFTVQPGGQHTDGATHNALIVFADGTYLELLAFLRPAPEHRWWPHVATGEGLIDWALLPDAIATDIAAAREQGLALAGPITGGRLRPDGLELAWEMGIPAVPGVPFLCGDVTPRERRVPTGALRQHANGVTGIADVLVAVHDIEASVPHYRALLTATARTPLPHRAVPESGARVAVFPAGAGTVTLAQPLDPTNGSVLAQQLARRGEGAAALTLRVGSTPLPAAPALPQSHGVSLRFVADEPSS